MDAQITNLKMMKSKKAKQDQREIELKRKYFSSRDALKTFLSDKYSKYYGMPVQLKSNIYPKDKIRVGFYLRHEMPTFMNHARLHWVQLGKKEVYLCEDEFDIYKKKIKDRKGKIQHYVDVKCPHCNYIGIYNMRYLIWNYNCKKCYHKLTVNNRVKKERYNISDFR